MAAASAGSTTRATTERRGTVASSGDSSAPARGDWTNCRFGNPTSAPGGRIGDDRRLDLSRDRPRESSIRRAVLWKPPMRPPLRVRRHATAAHRPSFRRSEAIRACLLGGDERSCDISCSPSGDGKASTPDDCRL